LSSAAPIDVVIKVLNICKSLRLPKTFNEQKRHGITQGLRLKLKRMMSLTTRNINELTHLFCAHVKLQTAHKMHLDSQQFEHLQLEACVVFETMNVFFGNIHFNFLFMMSSVYWNTICLPLNPVSEEAPSHPHSYHTFDHHCPRVLGSYHRISEVLQ
jgi:hypothetical protein